MDDQPQPVKESLHHVLLCCHKARCETSQILELAVVLHDRQVFLLEVYEPLLFLFTDVVGEITAKEYFLKVFPGEGRALEICLFYLSPLASLAL